MVDARGADGCTKKLFRMAFIAAAITARSGLLPMDTADDFEGSSVGNRVPRLIGLPSDGSGALWSHGVIRTRNRAVAPLTP